jgi:hypothetical protein
MQCDVLAVRVVCLHVRGVAVTPDYQTPVLVFDPLEEYPEGIPSLFVVHAKILLVPMFALPGH